MTKKAQSGTPIRIQDDAMDEVDAALERLGLEPHLRTGVINGILRKCSQLYGRGGGSVDLPSTPTETETVPPPLGSALDEF